TVTSPLQQIPLQDPPGLVQPTQCLSEGGRFGAEHGRGFLRGPGQGSPSEPNGQTQEDNTEDQTRNIDQTVTFHEAFPFILGATAKPGGSRSALQDRLPQQNGRRVGRPRLTCRGPPERRATAPRRRRPAPGRAGRCRRSTAASAGPSSHTPWPARRRAGST